MKLHATIELTEKDLLKAVNDAIEKAYRYSSKLPDGEALSIAQCGNGLYEVQWGKKPKQEETESAIKPAPEPATKEPDLARQVFDTAVAITKVAAEGARAI